MNNIIKTISSVPSMWDELKKEKKPLVLYGMGDGAVKLLSILDSLGLKCSGIFASDDFVRYQSFMGFTVKRLSDLEYELGDFTVLTAFATRLDSVMNNIRTISRSHALMIPDINVSGNHLEFFDRSFVSRFSDRLQEAYSSLDNHGQEFLEALVLYKYTGNIDYLDRIELLRLSSSMPYSADSIRSFADFGAYIGDTVAEACKLYPYLERVAAYEPDPKTFKKLVENTRELGIKVALFNALVWNEEKELTLRSGGAMNTIIEENVLMCENLQKKKCTSVSALTGDGSLPFAPDIIKMDIEGCELKAIHGCRDTIARHKPILRISLYHNHRDLFELIEAVREIRPDYRFTLTQKCKYIPAWDVEVICF